MRLVNKGVVARLWEEGKQIMTTAFQWVIDNAESISIDRLKTVAQSTARDGTVRTVARTGQPWRFTVRLPDGPRWTDYRQYISEIEALDRVTVGTIGITNAGHDWLIKYQGDLSSTSGITATWTTGNTITLTGGHTGLSSGQYIFRAGDIIQLDSKGCYTVSADVAYNESLVTLHRPIIDPAGVSDPIQVASACTWSVICTQFPKWTLFARDQVSWEGEFIFVEDLT